MADQDLRSVAYPKLDDERIAAIAHCTGATLRRVAAGEKLFDVGDRDFKFFVVRTGEVQILEPTGDGTRVIAVHGPGEFTGDISHLTGGASVVSAVARGDCEVYEVGGEALRQCLNQSPELCDLILQAFIARRQLLRESGAFTGVRVIGSRYSQDTFRIRDFLARNRVPLTWLDLETDPQVRDLLQRFGVSEAETPVVAWRDVLLRKPSNRELAELLGIRRPLERTIYDLVVVGAGPAGLAAAVYGASEGLRTVVLECTAPGGQAASSMRIENYLGFPTGLTGAELADRAMLQARKFGAELSVPAPVLRLRFDNGYPLLEIDGGETVVARALLIASGAEYCKLDVEDCERFEGCGVYYAATYNEALMCRGAEVVIVGGGNSAGQAAVFLASQTRKVYLVIRGSDLYARMSSYLARRIEQTENIEVLLDTRVRRLVGNGFLTAVEVENGKTGQVQTIKTPALFSFIGAIPHTGWLAGELELDGRGFVKTGLGLGCPPTGAGRAPFLLETSHRGVFAAGDVRSGSVKRVASAVGEGAMAVQFVHECFKEM
jgi:thioredoxin reductase (NADPH)